MPENIVLLLLTLTFSNHFLQRSIPALKGWRQMHCAFPWFSGLEQSGRFRRRLLLLRSLSAALVDTRVDACSFWASHSQMRAKSNIVAVFLNDTIIALFCSNEVVFHKRLTSKVCFIDRVSCVNMTLKYDLGPGCHYVCTTSNNPWGRNALVHAMTSRPLHLTVKASNQAYKTTHYNVCTLFDSQQPIP